MEGLKYTVEDFDGNNTNAEPPVKLGHTVT